MGRGTVYIPELASRIQCLVGLSVAFVIAGTRYLAKSNWRKKDFISALLSVMVGKTWQGRGWGALIFLPSARNRENAGDQCAFSFSAV